jgi:hypothetical protein
MPEYPSAEALLEDVDLRLKGLPPNSGALVVEGFDDKRLFNPLVVSGGQVVVSGGRRLLLAAHAIAGNDLDRVLFLTDCDFEVGMGRLRPAPSLVITKHADVEADLLDLLTERLAVEYVPDALIDDREAIAVADDLISSATAYASILGQARQLALKYGVEVNFDDIKYKDVRIKGTKSIDGRRLLLKIGQAKARECGLTVADFISEAESFPSGYMYSNGKDLVRAIQYVLREDYKITIEVDALMTSMRMCARDVLDRWSVARRIRSWEATRGRVILAP